MPEPPPATYSVDQIATLAGVSSRTVRYYIALGLLTRPVGEKRGAYYVQGHVEQLLAIRRWTDAGVPLDRVRELMAGAPEDPATRPARHGQVEVWSRVTLVDGLEIQVEPGRAGLSPEQMRALVRELMAAYHRVRGESPPKN